MASFALKPWFQKKIVDPVVQILRKGAEPKQLAFSTALGITLGVFPICGVTVFLCGMAIALLGSICHAPSAMLANFIATPIELSLVVPFLRLGEAISGGPQFPLTSDALKKVLTGKASREVLLSISHAVVSCLYIEPVIATKENWKDYYKIYGTWVSNDQIVMLLGWLVAAPFIFAALYIILLPCFKVLVQKFSTVPPSPKKPLQSHSDAKLKVREMSD